MKTFPCFALRIILLCGTVLLLHFNASADIVDTTFNASIETATYLPKSVEKLIPLPDGKTIAAGNFSNYNGQKVGGLIRLNADGSLDATFKNDLLKLTPQQIVVYPNGKVLLLGNFTFFDGTEYFRKILRLNADGAIDTSFTSAASGPVVSAAIDASGRAWVAGNLQVIINGAPENRILIRINDDGAVDASFTAPTFSDFPKIVAQNDKIIVAAWDSATQQTFISRLNVDGSGDAAFVSTSIGPFTVDKLIVQADNKILIQRGRTIARVGENGGLDPDFQQPSIAGDPFAMYLGGDGKILVGDVSGPSARFFRLLSNGANDPAFTPFTSPSTGVLNLTAAVNADGTILIGDSGLNSSTNNFFRLLPSGLVDASFNPGGTGFQNINPGKIRDIKVLPDGRILIGGDFQRVNGSVRRNIAILKPDSTLDNTFQITVGSTGNRFTQISDVYNIAPQSDGKILISGSFTYIVNGVQRINIARLSANGDVDPTFALSLNVNDYFPANSFGRNKPVQRSDGKVIVGTSRIFVNEIVPLALNANGSTFSAFNSTYFAASQTVAIFDLAIQQDGKILIAGRRDYSNATSRKGFTARLNADGTADQTFQPREVDGEDFYALSIQPNGQILLASRTSVKSHIYRLNSDGTLDGSFSDGTGASGTINTIATLPNGKALVGGDFTSYNGSPRRNFAVLDRNGNLDSGAADTDGEVLCISVDGQSRVLVGGAFTSINASGQQVERSYIARLVELSGSVPRTLFDFDGDGKADLAVRRPSDNIWYFLRTTAGFTGLQYGEAGDMMAPADYDGDGKTDVAVFRPSTGTWFIAGSSAGFSTVGWGTEGDIPVSADYDGDRKADIAIYRPSNGTWYRKLSNGDQISILQFGTAEDKPQLGDFDGDGKADLAVLRPSNNTWYFLRTTAGFTAQEWGAPGDITAPADFDGDGKTDPAVFRPSTGVWFIAGSSSGFSTKNWGTNGDVPVAADYDGDGKADAAVFRPSNNTWYLLQSTNGIAQYQFGANGDKAIPSVFNY